MYSSPSPSNEQQNRVNDTVAPNYKPRYGLAETWENPICGTTSTATTIGGSIRKRISNCCCSCVSFDCFYRIFCSGGSHRRNKPLLAFLLVGGGVACILLNRLVLVKQPPSFGGGQQQQNVGGGRDEFARARTQSYGLFPDLPESQWYNQKEHTRQIRKDEERKHHGLHLIPNQKRTWPTDFDCPMEQVVGGGGLFHRGGGITVCNPQGIRSASHSRDTSGRQVGDCLVYSSYNHPTDLKFETALLDVIGPCEIHVFNPYGLRKDNGGDFPMNTLVGMNTHLHLWGFEKSGSKLLDPKAPDIKSLQDTVQVLGHGNRTVDLFVLDCGGCELDIVEDWFDRSWFVNNQRNGVDLMQVIVKVHSARHKIMDNFFNTILRNGYVTYFKGKKERGGGSRWYGFLKLSPDYFVR